MSRIEFVPPGRAKRLWGWIAPSRRWGVMLLVSWRSWHIGAEVWRAGVAFNLGPLSLGGGLTTEAPAKISADDDGGYGTPLTPGNSGKQNP